MRLHSLFIDLVKHLILIYVSLIAVFFQKITAPIEVRFSGTDWFMGEFLPDQARQPEKIACSLLVMAVLL
jgi:hypothetical protein